MQEEDGVVELTREELYERVWRTPMARLGPELGISDVGLSKLCRRFDIPRPPRGHWARLQHGKPVKQPRLPRLDEEPVEPFVFYPGGAPAPTEAREVIARPEVLFPVTVPDDLADLHPVVARTFKSLRSAKANEQGLCKPRAQGALDVFISSPTVERAMKILDGLVRALDSLEIPIQTNNHGDGPSVRVVIDGEVVPFSLTEGVDRSVREPTPHEKRRRLYWRDETLYSYTPTGRLVLQVSLAAGFGIRRRWADGKKPRLEALLPAFIEALHEFAKAIKDKRAEDEARRQRWEAEYLAREERARLIHEEEQRLKGLLEEVDAWHRSQQVRAYVTETVRQVEQTQGSIETDSDAHRWVEWATAQADRIDPFVQSPPSILDEKLRW